MTDASPESPQWTIKAKGRQPPRRAYRIDEAAESIGVSRRMIYNLIAHGKLKTVKIGNCRRISAAALNAIVEKGARLS